MQLIRIYWRDIPSQVIIKKGRQRAKCKLPVAYQSAINRAAMRAGKGTSAAYIDDWRRESSTVNDDGELQSLAAQEAAKFAALVDEDQLEVLIKNKGFKPGV